MSIANEYFACKGTRHLQELNIAVELSLSSILESERNFKCHTRAILSHIQKGSWLLDSTSKEHLCIRI